MKAIIEDNENAQEKYPAAKVQPASGNLTWYLDSYAGRKLEQQLDK